MFNKNLNFKSDQCLKFTFSPHCTLISLNNFSYNHKCNDEEINQKFFFNPSHSSIRAAHLLFHTTRAKKHSHNFSLNKFTCLKNGFRKYICEEK